MINWLKSVVASIVVFALLYSLLGWLVFKLRLDINGLQEIGIKSAVFGLLFGSLRYFRTKNKTN